MSKQVVTRAVCANLFAATAEPVLIADAAHGGIIEANTAAARTLGTRRRKLIGSSLMAIFDRPSSQRVLASLRTVRSLGVVRLVGARAVHNDATLTATLSLVRQGVLEYLLVHLETGTNRPRGGRGAQPFVNDAIENGASGFLVTDVDLGIQYANKAILRMMEMDSFDAVDGGSLTQWLEFSREDLGRLQEQMTRRESVSVTVIPLHPRESNPRPVQVLAIAVPDGACSTWGFSVSERPCLN
jgi:PAS domain-containing protein